MTKVILERKDGVLNTVYEDLNSGDWFIDEDNDVCLKVDDSEFDDDDFNTFMVTDVDLLEQIHTRSNMLVTKIEEVKVIILK